MRAVLFSAGVLLLLAAPARAVDQSAIDRAIERGVAALKASQGPDGQWADSHLGATALAALTLLECGVPKEDRCVKAAADAVRAAGLQMSHTYSLSLSVLFLDKYNDPNDTPLIESMIVRLLAGQNQAGGWSYGCPGLSAAEVERIKQEMDPNRRLRGGRELDKLPEKGKRGKADLPAAIRDQLEQINRGAVAAAAAAAGADGFTGTGDNSNTQFATLALWVGRRYGIPTQDGLLRVAERFRRTQNVDGGWSYIPSLSGGVRGFNSSTATMTCAGLLGLACGHGGVLDKKKAKDSKVETIDVSKDAFLKNGLAALSTAVGKPVGWNGDGAAPPTILPAAGRAYYFLWSLERVAVILNLQKIGDKDWYNWGAEILLANQQPGGLWMGADAVHGNADTSFALLFLKKANLARDLSGALVGLKDGGRVLRGGAGPLGKGGLLAPGLGEKPGAGRAAAPAEKEKPSRLAPPVVGGIRPPERPRPAATTEEEKSALGLADAVLKGGGARAEALKRLRDSKGVAFTEALVWVISRQEGEGQKLSRVALAERFTRLKETTLREYLKDEEPEIRRAAAVAAAARGSKVLIPDLIGRLNDDADLVRRGAHAALKELAGKDLGLAPGAWQKWWKDNSRE